ncbi:DUF4142 domain-containing protein [Aquabacterium sp. A7-Y]|uniref:DUF4142 domain-containing protein n=1 Tax=Aquabacterium sp. A7-Y TaxID=1349605 RepID=UPI00223D41D1|nr:DUF4142 domain-containing protein [Aquabacterium sp. A7-Y]MCW7538017.1 DUF4142 domain-containing protein [Aquabacterium sp. A7-Y]
MTSTRHFIAALAAVAAALTASSSPAQQGNPAGTTPSSQMRAPADVPNPQDRLFVTLAGQGGLAEVQLARLALDKARSDAVKRFARRMLDEHSQANQQLAAAARQAGLVPPDRPSDEHRATYDRLARLDGAAFDEAYVRDQLIEHQKTTQVLLWEMGSGQQPALQRFASATLPTVLDHLEHVQQLLGELTGAATP